MSDAPHPPLPDAGWYADPGATGWLRWWDGRSWTADRSAMGPHPHRVHDFRTVGQFIATSFRAVVAAWRPLLVLAAFAVVPLAVGLVLAESQLGFVEWTEAAQEAFEDTEPGETADLPPWEPNAAVTVLWVAIVLGLYLACYYVLPLAAVPVIDAQLTGRPVALDHAVRSGLRAVPRAIAIGLVVVGVIVAVGLVVVAAVAVDPAFGFLLLLPALVLGVWAWIRALGLWRPIVVIEGLGVAQFGRSWGLTRGRFWRLFGRLLLFGVIVGLATNVVNLPLQFLTPVNLTLAVALSFTVGVAVGAASGIVTAAGEVVLYRELVGGPPSPTEPPSSPPPGDGDPLEGLD